MSEAKRAYLRALGYSEKQIAQLAHTKDKSSALTELLFKRLAAAPPAQPTPISLINRLLAAQ